MTKLKPDKNDRFIYDREIRPWLPDHIFDAHAHLLKATYHDYPDKHSDPFFYNVEMDDLLDSWHILFPDSHLTGLVMGMPVYNCDLNSENDFVAQSVTGTANHFSVMTDPRMSMEELEKTILTKKPAGLKPYLVHALIEDKQYARITDFITESQLELADKYKLAVTLHVSKPRGLADPDNLRDISRLVKQYPNCQFILAHCGRCFIPVNMAEALDGLPVAENLWFDTSAVCDTGVFLDLFSRYDLSRILFGTDLVNPTVFRGSYVGLGLSWHAVTPEMVERNRGLEGKATLAIYENLKALLLATRYTHVSDSDIRNIFYNNAANLFNFDKL